MNRITATDQLAAPQLLDIRAYLDVIRRRRSTFVQVFVSILLIGIIATGLSKPVYETSSRLKVPAGNTSVNIVDSNNPIATILQSQQPDNLETQMQDIMSSKFLADAHERAGIKIAPGVVPPSVRVEALEGTNVLEITVEGSDPKAIARLANEIVALHLENTDLNSTTGLNDTVRFVRKERDAAALQLARAEQQLAGYEASHRDPVSPEQREALARE